MNNKKKKLILGAIISIVIFGIAVNSIQFVINNREKDSVQDIRSNPFNKKDKKDVKKHNFWESKNKKDYIEKFAFLE